MAQKQCVLLLDFKDARSEKVVRSVFGKTYTCKRSNETGRSGDFVSEVVRMIGTADLVVADLTGHNPNVLYELGLAHAFRRETIVVKSVENLNDLQLPADLRQYKVIGYLNTMEGAEQLRERLEESLVALDGSSGLSAHLKDEIQWIEARIRASELFEDTMTKVFTTASQPLTAVLLEPGADGKTVARVRAASPDANRFYGHQPGAQELVDSDLNELLMKLENWMDPEDYRAFRDEQVKMAEDAAKGVPAYATVPIRLNHKHPHPPLRGRAFLPMVLGVTAPLGDRSTTYTIVLYLDVDGFLDNLVADYALPSQFRVNAAPRDATAGIRLSEFLSRLIKKSASGLTT